MARVIQAGWPFYQHGGNLLGLRSCRVDTPGTIFSELQELRSQSVTPSSTAKKKGWAGCACLSSTRLKTQFALHDTRDYISVHQARIVCPPSPRPKRPRTRRSSARRTSRSICSRALGSRRTANHPQATARNNPPPTWREGRRSSKLSVEYALEGNDCSHTKLLEPRLQMIGRGKQRPNQADARAGSSWTTLVCAAPQRHLFRHRAWPRNTSTNQPTNPTNYLFK